MFTLQCKSPEQQGLLRRGHAMESVWLVARLPQRVVPATALPSESLWPAQVWIAISGVALLAAAR